ncbi:hypothetical protein ACE1ET_02080 [Saccharicrinis sp. FJH62]|uniref:hypothetical protein n=1 Tax=Saccharicrinis sp. FJH62 TaxID=3344657 RepID=UPI0035D51B82
MDSFPKKWIFFIYSLLFTIVFCSCDNKNDIDCIDYSIIPKSPYDSPIWHPSDTLIGFNHDPLTKVIHYQGIGNCPGTKQYRYDTAREGYWLINPDGSNMRRALSFMLITPSWSPDGKWIAFSLNAQIAIMPFNGKEFDATSVRILTESGENFNPTWSHDGKRIVYSQRVCNTTVECGVWIVDIESCQTKLIEYNSHAPYWYSNSDSLIFLSRNTDTGESVKLYCNDTLKTLYKIPSAFYDIQHLAAFKNLLSFMATKNDGNGYQLYTVNLYTHDFKQLTTDYCYNYSWSPNGKIVYINYGYYEVNETLGALWIMDKYGDNKCQITKNVYENIYN